MRSLALRSLLLCAALLALHALLWGGPAEAARKQKAPAPVTYPHQEWRQTRYPSGELQTEWEVLLKTPDESVRNGIFRRYHRNGRLALLGRYRNDDPVGVWSWMDERGNLLRQTRQQADYDDEITGQETRSPISTFRNPAGQPTAEGQMKGDVPHGHWVFYYPGGAPKAEGDYLTGTADGQWNYFFPDGQIERQMRFALGVPDGPYRAGYDNGQERERGQYNQGLRTGTWRTWYRTGQINQEGDYREDRKVGEWRTWGEDGTLIGRTQFRDGAQVADLPVPQPPQPKEHVIPDETRLPIAPHLYTEDGAKVPIYDEDQVQYPPAPPCGKRCLRPPPLSTWKNADQAGQ